MNARHLAALLSLTLSLFAVGASAQTAFAWPTRDVDNARYILPEQCVALAGRLEASAWRGEGHTMRDTLPYDPQDTLPTSVVESVRRCVTKFPLERAAPAELQWLVHLDLVAHEDAGAKAAVARLLALARTKSERTRVLAATIAELLAARPARIADALSFAAQVDSLTNVADAARRNVHRQLLAYARSVLDTTLLATQLASYRPSGEVADMLYLVELRMLRQRIPDERAAIRDAVIAWTAAPGVPARQQIPDSALNRELDRLVAPAGPPRIAATFWFTSSPGDTIRPAPGKVSLLVFVGERCSTDANACAPSYAVLRRLHRRFGDSLDITLMARTDGYFRSDPPPTPAVEAERLRQYFLEDLGLGGALAVVSTPFTRLPDPDGRRREGQTPNLRYFGWFEKDGTDNRAAEGILSAFLVGPDGRVKVRAACAPDNERLLTALISKTVDAGRIDPGRSPAP